MSTKLLRQIKNSLPDLRKSEKVVGEFILKDPKSIITMKTAEASGAMGISEPTLIRFCKAIGFTGFQDLKINLIGGYTYMNPIALEPDKVYTESIGQISINGEVIGPELTYNNSSSDPSILKYRYQHIAKIDAELTYSDKYIVGSSVRFNDLTTSSLVI